MEKSKSFEARFARILLATDTSKDSELAKILNINQSSVVAARKRQQIPTGWIELVSEKFNVNANWLFFGEAPMRFSDTPHTTELQRQPDTAAICPRCATLKAELDSERKERRELSYENRQWAVKIEQVLRENGDLRERCATLEGQLKCYSIQKNS